MINENGNSSKEQQKDSNLARFLGTKRWKLLFDAIKRESQVCAVPTVGFIDASTAITIAVIPVALTILATISPSKEVDLPTIGFGVAAILAILMRWRRRLVYNRVKDWRNSLHLTHIAFALGCLPAVLILAFTPDFLANRHDVLAETMGPNDGGYSSGLFEIITGLWLLFGIALWVSTTEELIFRGLLISFLRRFNIQAPQWKKDLFALVFSAALFGFAHYPTWGIAGALALFSLGLGFGIGYLAAGETLLPIIAYHCAFDFLSMLIALCV